MKVLGNLETPIMERMRVAGSIMDTKGVSLFGADQAWGDEDDGNWK